MAHKKINIEIFGSHNNIVEDQYNIIKSLLHTSVNTQVHKDSVNYLEKASNDVDIVVINLNPDDAMKDLQGLVDSDSKGLSIIVIGDKQNVSLLSAAISAGVSEFLDTADYQNELLRVVNKIALNRSKQINDGKEKKLNVVINAKGGSGASFIASSVAYNLSQFSGQNVALMDLDLQFGSIGLNFDVIPVYSIVEALDAVNEMDHLSLNAYLSVYNEQLRLLLPSPDEIVLPGEIKPAALKSMLYMLQQSYNQIVIDLPRIIDPVFNTVLEQADNVVIVVQQTLAQYNDGRRLINILHKDLDIPLERIVVVINRFDHKNSLKKSDMIKLVNHDNVFTLDNDYDRVASAINLGEPLNHRSPKSKIAEDLNELAMYLGDIQIKEQKKGIFGRLFNSK